MDGENVLSTSHSSNADNLIGFSTTKYIFKVYGLVAVYFIVTISEVVPLLYFPDVVAELLDQRYLVFIIIVFFIMSIMLFFNFREIRKTLPYNILIIVLLIESAIGLLIFIVLGFKSYDVLIAFGVAIVIWCTTTIFAGVLPCDNTRHIVTLSIFLIILFLVLVGTLVATIFIRSEILILTFSYIALITVICFLAFHTQAILGGRLAEIRRDEYLYSSIIVYIDFFSILIFVLVALEPTLKYN